MKASNIVVLTLIFFTAHHLSLAQLGPGAIAFTGFNSDNPDGFSIIALEDIPSNTEIKFTDNGWQESGSFRSSESIMTWNAPANSIPAGTIVSLCDSGSWVGSTGSISGALSLASGSDQILAYTGEESSPSFLAAVQFNSNNAWSTDSIGTGESTLPDGLINGTTALALSALDNSVYTGTFEGTKAEVLQRINNPDNWYGSDNYHIHLEPGLFPCSVIINSGEWDFVSNWKAGNFPDNTTSVVVAEDIDVNINAPYAVCKNLFIEPRGTVEINNGQTLTVTGDLFIHSRSVSYAGEIINYGTLSILGTTTYERYIPGDDWHIVASPVSGQAINDFVISNSIQYFEQEDNYDLAPYDESTDSWNPYTTISNNTNMVVGKGYAMRRSENASSTGIVSFTGTLNQADVQITLNRNNNGWNCLGNPFASALKGTGNENSFLANNIDMLDPEFAGLYLWDYNINDYRVFVNSDNEEIAPCQGFIIRAKNDGEIVNIDADLQVFAFPSFKSEELPWPTINLIVSGENVSNYTRFVFNNEMTNGLDPTYDAGKLKGNPSFALYSHLVEDGNVDLAVQALPIQNHEMLRIPLGLDCNDGGMVTFTAFTEELPAGMQVILEDTQNNEFTNLSGEGTAYSTFIDVGTNGTGRFYLLTSNESITYTNELSRNELKINIKDKIIDVFLSEASNPEVTLYNSVGQLCDIKTESGTNKVSVNANSCPKGIYILMLKAQNEWYTQKVILF